MPRLEWLKKELRVFILVAPFIIFIWLGWKYFAISGKLNIDYDFTGESPFIEEFLPLGRALDREKNLRTGEVYQKVVGEPVYLEVEVPRSFDQVTATIEYDNEQQPLVEFGIVSSEEPWNVRLFPLENKIIDQALLAWSKIEQDGVVLLQREGNFTQLDQFLADFPKNENIATYNYELPIAYRDDNYKPQETELVIDRALRGSHEFVVYIKDETLNVEFKLRDINREFNADTVTLSVKSATETIHEQIINDDGIDAATGQVSAVQVVPLTLGGLAEGAYTISFNSSNDIVIEQIRTAQEKFVVKSHVFIINNSEYEQALPDMPINSSTIYFDGPALWAKTDHPQGLQTVQIDNDDMPIEQVKMTYWWFDDELPSNELHTMRLPQNDLYLRASYSYFSFSQDSYFDPNYQVRPVDESTRLDDLNYIIYANYTSPVTQRRFLRQIVPIDLTQIFGNRKKLTFVLSAPGLDRNHYSLTVHNVEFSFARAPLWRRLKERWLKSLP